MSAPRVKPGDLLAGKYRVEKVLGAGGMGMVVAARHVELGQRVALKFMLREAMQDPAQAERFAREARSAVQLKSAHVARVLDVGRMKNGEPFMVMEYLDGQDLDDVIRTKGPLPPHVAVDFVLQACEAIAEAHGLGMIHRDIKLKNLYLTQTLDGRPFVKVLDFGLAKQVGGALDVSLTATTAVFGSPQYMSPEQMRSAKDVDSRSDVWSIGVCLYELLTGRVPFDAGGLAEICAMVLKDPVTPPSQWAPGLPKDLEAVVMKCLDKDVRGRFQTVVDLGFALEPWSTAEGSARRIRHVMEAAQRVEIPTIRNEPPAADGPKTVSSWDSGERAKTTRLSPAIMASALGALLFLGVIGAVAAAISLRRAPTTAAVVSADPPPKASEALAPPTASAPPAATDTATEPAETADPPAASATPTAPAATALATKPHGAPAAVTARPRPQPAAATTAKPSTPPKTPQKPSLDGL